ncbi:MAG: hypothetical protein ABIL58_24480 [Pseudomonadota bacterium]
MEDQRGRFYYPYPQNHRIRMYVRKVDADICFRLWDANDATLWDTHGWVPFTAIKQAMTLYQGKGFDPATAYDIRVAAAVLSDDR